MISHLDQIIKKDSSFDRGYLQGLSRCPLLSINVSVVYIYSLVGNDIEYPNCSGKILYIGESEKNTEPTGTRFAQHISPKEEKGATGGMNYCLSCYYWSGTKIRLRIFLLNENENKKAIEKELLQIHVKKFGALPICQGTTSNFYHTTKLHKLKISDDLKKLI